MLACPCRRPNRWSIDLFSIVLKEYPLADCPKSKTEASFLITIRERFSWEMTVKIRVFSCLISAFAVMACTSSTPYAPIDGRYGYSEQKIETNRYRVVFNGNSSTSREDVELFLLYRAAEITIAEGMDYFQVIEHETDTSRSYRSTDPHIYGYYPYSVRRFPYYAHGYPWSYASSLREVKRFEAHAFIVLQSGEKPTDDPSAYAAEEVITNLESDIRRSQIQER